MRKLITLFILLSSFPLLADFDDKCSVIITLRFQNNDNAYKDAINKIKAGATLVQIHTGFIYEGPSLIKKINTEIINQNN